mgnify:CR=1 FL=1
MYYIENASNKTWVLGINGDDENFVKTVRFSTNSKTCQMAVFTFSNALI